MAMFSDAELHIVRRAYARQVAAAAGTDDPRIIAALATLRREDFLPPGPWPLYRGAEADRTTPDADPLYLYQDVAVPILPEKGLNNGVPSFVTRLIAAADIREGDRVVHVGTGTGYYTAVMARLAGDLLASYPAVRVRNGDGWSQPLGTADVVLVNAGSSGISLSWLDALPSGGRLVVPLAARQRIGDQATTRGVVLCFLRDVEGFEASVVSQVAIYPCMGADGSKGDERLRAALDKGGARQVRRIVCGRPPDEAACWLVGEGWFLA